jgi:NAD-dependent SIR2 family protein deacetylase
MNIKKTDNHGDHGQGSSQKLAEFQNEITLACKISSPKPGDCPYTLFIGAGASITSGIPSAAGMIRKWKILLHEEEQSRHKSADPTSGLWKKTFIDYETWEKDDYGYAEWLRSRKREQQEEEYSILFGHFFHEAKERQIYIEQIIDGNKPTFGYMYLAGLIKAQRFNRIMTTNFDDLLNDALVRYYDIRPIVCAFDSAVSSVRITSLRPKIIKLHGDYLYDNMRNMKQELRNLDTNMEEKMYEMCKDAGLVVVGYSGSDESIMAPLRDMLRKPGYLSLGLHWCLAAEDSDQVDIPYRLEDLRNNYGDRVHLYKIKSFDGFMEVLFSKCSCELPDGFRNPGQYNIPVEFRKAVQESSSIKRTPQMNRILEEITKSAQQLDSTQFELFRVDDIFNEVEILIKEIQSASQQGAGNKSILCKEKLNESIAIIGKCLQRTLPLGSVTDLFKRKSAMHMQLAQLSFTDGSGDHLNHITDAITSVEEGILRLGKNPHEIISPVLIRTMYYNGCCAYALKCQYAGDLSLEERSKVGMYIKEIIKLDFEGNEIKDLLKDEDFKPYIDKYPEEMKRCLA